MEIKIIVHAQRAAIAENAAERRLLNGPSRVPAKMSCEYRETLGIRQLSAG